MVLREKRTMGRLGRRSGSNRGERAMGAETGGAAHPVGDEGSSLLDYVGVVRRRKWIVLQALVLVPIVALLLSLRQSPLYRGTATVLFNGQRVAASVSGPTEPAGAQG